MWRVAFSARSFWATVMAGDSRVSPVSFLYAKPRIANFLLDKVLCIACTMRFTNRAIWYSLTSTTAFQYAATSGRFRVSEMYTRFRISFLKQLPPKPTEAFIILEPIRVSRPTAYETSCTLAETASHIEERALMLEMRCASMAFAANLDSSDDHRFIVMSFSRGIQLA